MSNMQDNETTSATGKYVIFCDSENCYSFDYAESMDELETAGWEEVEDYNFCSECVAEMIGEEDGLKGETPEIPSAAYLRGYKQGIKNGGFLDDLS